MPTPANALAEALCDDPFYRAVSQKTLNPEERLALLTRYFDAAMVEAGAVGRVETAGEGGAALWLIPSDQQIEATETARREAVLADVLGPKGLDTYRAVSASMAALAPPETTGAWYLSILGVRPTARGQGLAQRLLASTLAEADQAGAVTWLETFNPLNIPFYHRLGFTTVHPRHEPVLGRTYWLMLRGCAPSAL